MPWGNTLFPAESPAAGIRQDFVPVAPLLVRLRVIHPLLSVVTGAYLLYVAWLAARRSPGGPHTLRFARLLAMGDEVGQQALGLERGRLGQWLIAIADVERPEEVEPLLRYREYPAQPISGHLQARGISLTGRKAL